jgi:hypothetical protein
MTSYLVEIELPTNYSEEFERKINTQRLMVNKLIEKGVILSYSLATNRSKLWFITHAISKSEVFNMIASMPLYDYFVQYLIHELLFSETTEPAIPQPSLN